MELKDLMRHADVSTTEKYYVGVNARRTSENLKRYKQAAEVNW